MIESFSIGRYKPDPSGPCRLLAPACCCCLKSEQCAGQKNIKPAVNNRLRYGCMCVRMGARWLGVLEKRSTTAWGRMGGVRARGHLASLPTFVRLHRRFWYKNCALLCIYMCACESIFPSHAYNSYQNLSDEKGVQVRKLAHMRTYFLRQKCTF